MTVTISNTQWMVVEEQTVEDYMGGRANLLELCKRSGIEAVVTVKRPNGKKSYQAYRYANGNIRWAQ